MDFKGTFKVMCKRVGGFLKALPEGEVLLGDFRQCGRGQNTPQDSRIVRSSGASSGASGIGIERRSPECRRPLIEAYVGVAMSGLNGSQRLVEQVIEDTLASVVETDPPTTLKPYQPRVTRVSELAL